MNDLELLAQMSLLPLQHNAKKHFGNEGTVAYVGIIKKIEMYIFCKVKHLPVMRACLVGLMLRNTPPNWQ